MKEKQNSVHKYYGQAYNFYYDDILSIYNILKNISENVIITTDQFEIEHIEELQQINAKKIYLNDRDNNISVTLDIEHVSIHSYSKNEILALGIVSKVEAIFKKAKKRVRSIFKNFVYRIIFQFVFFIVYLFLLSSIMNSFFTEYKDLTKIVVPIGFIIIIVTTDYLISTKNTFVLNITRTKYSFYKEHKELINNIISSIAGAIVGFVLGKIF